MKTHAIVTTRRFDYISILEDFEEAYYDSNLKYSLRHIALIENISEVESTRALQKSLQTCHLVGIESTHHFKKIYIYDEAIHSIYIDWIMSQKGFNLMVMQFRSMSEKKARWLWELA
jgi:hypothetical protein